MNNNYETQLNNIKEDCISKIMKSNDISLLDLIKKLLEKSV